MLAEMSKIKAALGSFFIALFTSGKNLHNM